MSNKNNKVHYPREDKSGEVKRLKGQIRALEHEIKRLKSELKTFNKAFEKNITFLRTKTKNFDLQELIDGAKLDMTLEEIGEEKQFTFKKMEDKWRCRVCSEGVLKLIIVPGNRYFRKCSMNNCKNRTEVKEYLEENKPEGIE